MDITDDNKSEDETTRLVEESNDPPGQFDGIHYQASTPGDVNEGPSTEGVNGSKKQDISDSGLYEAPPPTSWTKKCFSCLAQTKFCGLIVCVLVCCFLCLGMFIVMAILIQHFMKQEKKHEEKIPDDPYDRAVYLAKRTPLVDGHNDIIERLLGFLKKGIPDDIIHLDRSLTPSEINLLNEHNTTLMTDIPRMKAGHVGCQFWAVYTSCKIRGWDSVNLTMESFRYVGDMLQIYSESFRQVFSSSQLLDVFSNGFIGGIPGVEGGQMINMNLNILREYYRLGARYMTLTHQCNTRWADSCCDPKGPEFHGLAPFGFTVLEEMNRIGMIIDISHVSVDVMHQVLDFSKAPVMFSHSNARALCNSTRNAPDNVLIKLKENNGIIMVTFVPGYLVEKGTATLDDVANHIDYIKKVHGNTEHIGIGSDFDGISSVPVGLEDASKFMDLIAELIRRGYEDFEIDQILGGNLVRVFSDVEKVSSQLGMDSIFNK